MNSVENSSLVLNADFRPLSYFPLSLWSWQDTIKAVFLKRVNIISEYETEIHSPSLTIKLPSVISLKEYVPLQPNPAFTRFNVFLRDNFKCQYCHNRYPVKKLTFDHLIPKSRGGKTSWENVVSACTNCNFEKGHSNFLVSLQQKNCIKMGKNSLLIICIKAGEIIYIGIQN